MVIPTGNGTATATTLNFLTSPLSAQPLDLRKRSVPGARLSVSRNMRTGQFFTVLSAILHRRFVTCSRPPTIVALTSDAYIGHRSRLAKLSPNGNFMNTPPIFGERSLAQHRPSSYCWTTPEKAHTTHEKREALTTSKFFETSDHQCVREQDKGW